MGQTCFKTDMKKDSKNPTSTSGDDDDDDFVYRTPWPYSESTYELKSGKESLLIRTRLRISYNECAIQPGMSDHWPEVQANHKPRRDHHHHKRRHHQHHNRCDHHHHHHHHQKYSKIKEDSGFMDHDTESDQATVSFDNETKLPRRCYKSSAPNVQNTINWLSTVQPSKQHNHHHHHHHGPHHHRRCHRHQHNFQNNDNICQHQTINNQPAVSLFGNNTKSILLNQYDLREWCTPSKRLVAISSSPSSSSSPSPSRDEKMKSKHLAGRYVIGNPQRNSDGRIFDVKGQLIRQDINHSSLELQKFVMNSFIANNVKFSNSPQFKLPS